MRRIFASPRLENVGASRACSRNTASEVRITDGRSYRGAIRGNFSYRDDARRPGTGGVDRQRRGPAARARTDAAPACSIPPRAAGRLPPAGGRRRWMDAKPRKLQRTLETGAARGDRRCGGGRQLRGAACVEAQGRRAGERSGFAIARALPDRVAELLFWANSPTSATAPPPIGLAAQDAPPAMLARWPRRTRGSRRCRSAGRRRHPRSRQRTTRAAARAARLSHARRRQRGPAAHGTTAATAGRITACASTTASGASPPRRNRRAGSAAGGGGASSPRGCHACRPADGRPASPIELGAAQLAVLVGIGVVEAFGLLLLPRAWKSLRSRKPSWLASTHRRSAAPFRIFWLPLPSLLTRPSWSVSISLQAASRMPPLPSSPSDPS